MEELKQCPICGESRFSTYLKCVDHFLTKEEFTIVTCDKCAFTFVNPRPEAHKLHMYYDSPAYISHSGTNKGIVNAIYKKVRNYTHAAKVRLVASRAKGKSILDIGCASGELLSLFKQHKWDVLGLEPNQHARNFAKNQYGVEVLDESEIGSIPSKSKDVVSMWHVLEHVAGLNERMLELKRILKDDGVVFIAVPNRISYDAEYYKEYWAAYDVPRHIYHFTPETMKELMEKYQFSIEEILPMKFDSFYVSMLSEKYASGKSNLIKAFFIGLLSNWKARKSKVGYSSLIYVVRNSKK